MKNDYFKGLYHKDFEMVERPRIKKLLETSFEKPFVVIEAGSGYGKSYEVSNYLEQYRDQAAWIQNTAMENIPANFWEKLIEAVPDHFKEFKQYMRKMGLPDSDAKMNKFVASLAKALFPVDHTYLVLDDFHRLYNPVVLEFIKNIIHLQLENLTVILLTRIPIELDSDLIKSKDIAYIKSVDLAFTKEETEMFFAKRGMSLESDILENIYQSSEGWAIALKMIAVRSEKVRYDYSTPLDLTIEYIHKYIEREVFYRYPADVQSFFIKLTFLDQNDFSEAFLMHLSGKKYMNLLEIFKKNMFIVYNSYSESFHIHHIFIEYLKRLQDLIPDSEITDLYFQTGKYFERVDLKINAITFYRKCEAWEEMFSLILNYGTDPRPKAVANLFLRLIDEIPEVYKEKDSWIRLTKANLLTQEARFTEAEEVLKEVMAELEKKGDSMLLGEAYLSLGNLKKSVNHYDFVQCYVEADRLLPNGSAIFNQQVKFVNSMPVLDIWQPEENELEKMVGAIFSALPHAASVMNGAGYGAEYQGAGERFFYRGEFSKAKVHFKTAIQMAKTMHQSDIICSCYFYLIRIAIAEGDYEHTTGYKKDMEDYIAAHESKTFYSLPDIIKGWFACKMQESDQVPGWILDENLFSKTQLTCEVGRDYLLKGIYLLNNKKYYELLGHCDFIEGVYTEKRSWMMLLYAKILKAICYYRLEQNQKALKVLKKAYDMAIDNEIIVEFIELGNDMRSLTHVALNEECDIPEEWLEMIHRKSSAYAKKVKAIITRYRKEKGEELNPENELTEKEVQILKSLCQGLTRDELASVYQISINTVKSRLKNIYSKLGAINSIDAVRIATLKGIIT